MINDIQLTKTSDNTFDWTFDKIDLVTVTGRQRVESAVKHAILLKKGELIQDIYSDKGCGAYDYMPNKYTDNVLGLIQESLAAACKEVDDVSDAEVAIQRENNKIAITQIVVTRNNGEEMIIDGI